MLGTLCLAMLIAPHRFSPVVDSFMPATEAFGELVSAIEKNGPNPHFHSGASLLGGVLNANSSASYSIVTHDETPHHVILAGERSATKLSVDVVDNTGKSVVTQRMNGAVAMVTFQGKPRGNFKIVAKNLNPASKGDFFALAILESKGGVEYSPSSITTAVGKLATAIQAGFAKGYGFASNKFYVTGNLMEPGKNYNSFGKIGGDHWLSISTSDAQLLTLNVAFKDKSKNEITASNVQDGECRLFEFKAPASNMVLTNTGANRLLVFTCTMD